MRKTFQRLFLLFLLCAVNFAAAGTVRSITDLAPEEDGTYILETGYIYTISAVTRDAADSSRFSASIPCRITPSLGTTAITVRAYSTQPSE